ncbi:MAG: FlgD immunoglobulin-like domain containing protein [bacterium]
MKSKWIGASIICLIMLISWSYATVFEDQAEYPVRHTIETNTNPVVLRQAINDDFERTTIAPWTTSGYTWDIRDTTNTYGPDTHAVSGYRYAGCPSADIAQYAGTQTGYLVTPTIDITGWDSLFLSFNFWADWEGTQTNFDGGIVQISPDNGASWIQIDSLAVSHLNPTYDAQLAGTGALGTAWAYCYDRHYWVNVGSMDLMALGYANPGDQIQIRFTFCSDPAAAGMGWFVDDVRIDNTSPPDLQPPVIVHTPLPDTTDTLSNYTITATVTDAGSGLDTDSVYLHYQIESGSEVHVMMTNVGADDYEADIPAQSFHTDIYYYVTAADNAGNEASTPVYNFEVTNARTIIYDDGQPWWAPDVITPGDGCFVQFRFPDVGIDSGLVHQVKFLFEGPGSYDVRIYQGTTGQPGSLIDSIAGLSSTGYEWNMVELTNLNIRTNDEVVVGYIIGAGDSLGLLRDSSLNYQSQMWKYVSGNWQGGVSGDHMLRLKVIPITFTGIYDSQGNQIAPFNFGLGQIAPNPMHKNTAIEFYLKSGQKTSLNVYDVSGQLVRTLVDHFIESGIHQVSWNGLDNHGVTVPSGVYFLKLVAGDHTSASKLLVLK